MASTLRQARNDRARDRLVAACSSPFAPSLEQVQSTLAGAIELFRGLSYQPPSVVDEKRRGLSLREALDSVGVSLHRTASYHARLHLERLVGAYLYEWEQGQSRRQAMALLKRGLSVLTEPEARGWRVSSGPSEAPTRRFPSTPHQFHLFARR